MTRGMTEARSVSLLTPAVQLQGFALDGSTVDARGCPVVGADGVVIGVVQRLLVDMRTRLIRYLGVALDDGRRPSRTRGIVLVPVGMVRRNDGTILLDGLLGEDLARAPRITERPVTRADERATLDAYRVEVSDDALDAHSHPLFDPRTLLAAERA